LLSTGSQPLRDWLQVRRHVNELYLTMMSWRYDLDGAVEARQVGLAWHALGGMTSTGVQLYLLRAGVDIRNQPEGRMDRTLHQLNALAHVHPALAGEAWQYWLRPVPNVDELPPEIDRTLTLLRDGLGLPWVSTRRETVLQWAHDTRSLRQVAKEFGLAHSDDWYLSAVSINSPDFDWFREVVDSLYQEGTE
jgi:hypothetical protein